MPTEPERLQRARDLIMHKQFDQARLILLDMPGNPTAQKWLAKLEEIAPTGTGSVPQTPLSPEPATPIQPLTGSAPPIPMVDTHKPTRDDTVNIALNITTVRYVVAGATAVLAVLMIASFFLAPWMDLGQINFFGMDLGAMGEGFDVDEGPLKVTAMELWMGRNSGENFAITLEEEPSGFADVRLLDRLLILIPVGAIVLAWFAWSYIAGDMNEVMTLGIMTMIAFLLLTAPFAWESLSNQQIEDEFNGSMQIEGGDEFGDMFGAMFGGMLNFWEDTYSTGEQKILGGLALLVCLAGFGAEVMSQAQTGARHG